MKKVRSLAVTPKATVSESAIRLSNRYDVLESEEPVMRPMSVEKREFQPRLRRVQVHRGETGHGRRLATGAFVYPPRESVDSMNSS